jgi:REP element-mobilizing transposase RayT
MARALRLEFEGAIYHILGRGNARQRIFEGERDRLHFLELLEGSIERFDVAIQAFVLMRNHFHLVAQTRQANLSRWMHWLMVSYTVYFNRRHGRSGHLFQGRYKGFLVEQGEYHLGLSRYLHLNPVRGKVLGRGTPVERRRRLREYEWSSYRGYGGLAKPFGFVEEAMILGELQGARKVGMRERLQYRRFVEEGLVREMENPFEAVRWQTVLGSESFARKMQDRLRGMKGEGREVTAVRRGARGVKPMEVVRQVARSYGVRKEALLGPGEYGWEARNVAMALVWEKCAISLRELGELFGGLDYAAVAQRIRRIKKANPPGLNKARQMSNVNV